MRGSAIAELLTTYYAAPKRISFLKRRLGELQARVSLLETELGDPSLNRMEGTLPGTIASYGGPTGHSNLVSDPTLVAVAIRWRATRRDIKAELEEKYADIHEKERELDDLERLQACLNDILNDLEPGDRVLLRMRYVEKLSNEQIADRECGGATEKVARKRLQKIEQEIARAYLGARLTTRAEKRPKGVRKASERCPKKVRA